MSSLLHSALQLARQNRNKFVPFVGAGMTVPLGTPTWSELVEELQQFAGLKQTEQTAGDASAMLGEIRSKLGTTVFCAKIQQRLTLSGKTTTKALQALATCGAKKIVTTNLDSAIETAFLNCGQPLPPHMVFRGYSSEELSGFWREQEGPALLKLHGSIERPSTWVLTPEEYDKAYIDPGNLRGFFSESNFVPFFIGFGFNDRDISEALRFAKVARLKHGFIAVRYDMIPFKDTDFKGAGLIPIPFHTYDQIAETIDEVFECQPLRAITAHPVRPSESNGLLIGGSEVTVDRSMTEDAVKAVVGAIANALEVQPIANQIDDKRRRLFGYKGYFLDFLKPRLAAKGEQEARIVLQAICQYPDLFFDLSDIVLKTSDIDQYMFLDLAFASLRQLDLRDEQVRLKEAIVQRIQNQAASSDLACSCSGCKEARVKAVSYDSADFYDSRRALAKIAANEKIHPAMIIPPPTIRVGTLEACVYPLTRYQVGELLSEETLLSKHPLRPYTLDSKGAYESILAALARRTGRKWRLPSRAEWMQLAGLEGHNAWPWGEEEPQKYEHAHLRYVDHGGNAAQHPLEVGIFPKGKSRTGLFDLIGNSYEIIEEEEWLAGGAWTTAFRSASKDQFRLFTRYGHGKNNVGLRPVRNLVN